MKANTRPNIEGIDLGTQKTTNTYDISHTKHINKNIQNKVGYFTMAIVKYKNVFFVFLLCLFLIYCKSDDNKNNHSNTNRLGDGVNEKVQLSTGSSHSCVSNKISGNLYCWGSGEFAKLGNGSEVDALFPIPVTEGVEEGIASVSASEDHTCYSTEDDGRLFCVGSQENGRLGDGQGKTDTGSMDAVLVVSAPGNQEPITGVKEISSTGAHTCILVESEGSEAARVKCWGLNDSGQLGDGTRTEQMAPVDVIGPNGEALLGALQVSAGFTHSCALVQTGESTGVFCWGNNTSGQLGDGTTVSSNSAVPVLDSGGGRLTGVAEVRAGYSFTCARMSDGAVLCWGEGPLLGNNATPDRADSGVPVNVMLKEESKEEGSVMTSDLSQTTFLTVGHFHACAIREDQSGVCWGDNNSGQVGINSFVPYQGIAVVIHAAPENTEPLGNLLTISAGHNFTCALVGEAGSLKCWGNGVNGFLGNGFIPKDNSLAPVDILAEDGESFEIFKTEEENISPLNKSQKGDLSYLF